jgi:16S rRNA (cytidine1402-2'-O)-methyltransferase
VAYQAPGRLYVVATPIGTLGDLSPRAREILQTCSLIAAEDTRHTGILLKHFGIQTPQLSLHDHNEQRRAGEIIERLRDGASVALVSDAGTPAISDPGFELARAVAAAGFEIIAVPGPCAAIAALSIAGLPRDRSASKGFARARAALTRKRLQALRSAQPGAVRSTCNRVRDMLEDCGGFRRRARAAVVVREITKPRGGPTAAACASSRREPIPTPISGAGKSVLPVAGARGDGRRGRR